MHTQDSHKWLRWFVLDHALLLVPIVMIATVFSVLLYRSSSDATRTDVHLQRSIEDRH